MSQDAAPYAFIPRLAKILQVLRNQPATARQPCETLSPGVRPASEADVTRTIRDVRALRQLGFQIGESGKPITFTLRDWPPPPFSNEELQTLALIREAFG